MSETNDEALRKFRAAKLTAAFKAKTVEPPCDDCDDDPVTAAADGDILFHGYATLYDTPSGDGRMIAKDSLTWDLEEEGIPIIWDRQDGDHTGMILGRVDTAHNDGVGPFVTGRLFATDDPEVQIAKARVAELIAENALGWSVMLDGTSTEVTIRDPEVEELADGTRVVRMSADDDMAVTTKGRIRHLALVDTPALPGARPILGPPPAVAAAALLATYPAAHFEKWESRTPVPFQYTADGRVWGHAAGDGCLRNGNTVRCDKYQRDPDPQLRNFHTSTATLDNGEVIRVGSLTAAGLHADTADHSLSSQRQHHENSTTRYAVVRAWEDAFGRLCVSGSVIPGLPPAFVSQAVGLGLSVEKWPVQGVRGLTLVGAHAPITQAWPVI